MIRENSAKQFPWQVKHPDEEINQVLTLQETKWVYLRSKYYYLVGLVLEY